VGGHERTLQHRRLASQNEEVDAVLLQHFSDSHQSWLRDVVCHIRTGSMCRARVLPCARVVPMVTSRERSAAVRDQPPIHRSLHNRERLETGSALLLPALLLPARRWFACSRHGVSWFLLYPSSFR